MTGRLYLDANLERDPFAIVAMIELSVAFVLGQVPVTRDTETGFGDTSLRLG